MPRPATTCWPPRLNTTPRHCAGSGGPSSTWSPRSWGSAGSERPRGRKRPAPTPVSNSPCPTMDRGVPEAGSPCRRTSARCSGVTSSRWPTRRGTPRPSCATSPGNWKPLKRRLGEAFVEYIERYPIDATPQTAGVNATVVVTMTLEQLLGRAGRPHCSTTAVGCPPARPAVCRARQASSRSSSGPRPSRSTSAARPGSSPRPSASHSASETAGAPPRCCDTTASGCHAHHDDPWARGGITDLTNGRLLCPRHHRLAHDPRYAKTVHADNKVTFARRT